MPATRPASSFAVRWSKPWRAVARAAAVGIAVASLSPLAASAQTRPAPGAAYFDFLMARRLEAQGDNAAALVALKRAEAADPQSAEVKAEIAAFHLRRNQRTEAEQYAKAALALDEKNVEANRTLGFVYTAAAENAGGRGAAPAVATALSQATLHLERALAGAVVPDPNVQFTLGRLYLRTGDSQKAVQVLTRAVAQSPGSVQARLALAQAYGQVDDARSAIGVLEEIVLDEPRVAAALGQYQEQAGLLADAAESYTVALAVQPMSRELKFRRIAVLYNAKDYRRAAAFAAEARKQHPDDTRFPRLEARALFDAGDRADAVALIERTATAFPSDIGLQFAQVDLYADAGQPAAAEKVLRQILTTDPSNPNALNYLGYLLTRRDDRLDEAIALVRRAVDADPQNGAYLDSLGWAYYRKGDLEQAEKYLADAAARLPRNSEIQDHLGDVYARRGRLQEAIDAWTRALEGDRDDIDSAAVERKLQDARRKLGR